MIELFPLLALSCKIPPAEQTEIMQIEQGDETSRQKKYETKNWLSGSADEPVTSEFRQIEQTTEENHGPDKLIHQEIMDAPRPCQIDSV